MKKKKCSDHLSARQGSTTTQSSEANCATGCLASYPGTIKDLAPSKATKCKSGVGIADSYSYSSKRASWTFGFCWCKKNNAVAAPPQAVASSSAEGRDSSRVGNCATVPAWNSAFPPCSLPGWHLTLDLQLQHWRRTVKLSLLPLGPACVSTDTHYGWGRSKMFSQSSLPRTARVILGELWIRGGLMEEMWNSVFGVQQRGFTSQDQIVNGANVQHICFYRPCSPCVPSKLLVHIL